MLTPHLAAAVAAAACLCVAIASGASYTNPVLDGDHPDPGVLFDPATKLYWAATTGANADGRYAHTDINWRSLRAHRNGAGRRRETVQTALPCLALRRALRSIVFVCVRVGVPFVCLLVGQVSLAVQS